MTITKQQWLTDIENTKKECQAYWQIAEGFEILEQLPENKESGWSVTYQERAFHYLFLWNKCSDFLNKLQAWDGEFTDELATTPES